MSEYRRIKLRNGKYALVDAQDYDSVSKINWAVFNKGNHHDVWDIRSSKSVNGKQVRITIAKVIMNPPKGMVVDHINGNALDNRRKNLRICTPIQNRFNRRKMPWKRYKGIYYSPGIKRWQAEINNKYIGCYKTAKEAAMAYNEKAKVLHGEYANLNKF